MCVATLTYVTGFNHSDGALEVLNGEPGDEITIGITIPKADDPTTVALSSLCKRGSSIEIDAVVPEKSVGLRVTDFTVVTLDEDEAIDAWVNKPLAETIDGSKSTTVEWDCGKDGRAPLLVVEVERTNSEAGRLTNLKLKYGSEQEATMRYGMVACPIDINTPAGQAACAKYAPF